MGSYFKFNGGWKAQHELWENERKLKREYKEAETAEEVGLQLDECQRKRLYELKNQAEKNQDGTPKADEDINYTELYKFIK